MKKLNRPAVAAASSLNASETVARAGGASIRTSLARELRELVAALDRRVPRVERAGEAAIARDAAALKTRALTRLAELEQTGTARSAAAQAHATR